MRFFLWLLFLFATAIGLAVTARFNPGNVVLFYPPYRVDLSLNLFLLLALAVFLIMYGVVEAVRQTRNMPRKVAAYRQVKRERDANQALRDALKSLFEGRFGQAERAVARAIQSPENAGLAALIGARAANGLRQFARRDTWLNHAVPLTTFKPARLMTALELLVEEHQTERALATVAELNATGTRHIQAQRLALKANQYAQNWTEVLRLTRALDKNNALHPALSTRLRELAYSNLLSEREHDAESLRNRWHTITADEKVRPYVAMRAALAFNHHGLFNEARVVIEKALAVEWDDRLIKVYRQCAGPEGSPILLEQIEQCEHWNKDRPMDVPLALTLGTLCLRQKLWGKAQRHLEQALAHAGDSVSKREAHLELAQLHEALGHTEQAATHYRQSALTI
jgi:HemY protein